MESPADKEVQNSLNRKRQCSFPKGVSNNSSSSPLNSRRERFSSVRANFDVEVLDCPICFEPFHIPVFQCENGHTACSSCCQRLAKKCPSCARPIDSIRCRAIEMVLESARLGCPNRLYGCYDSFSYDKSFFEHEKICGLSPCSCPIPGCKLIKSATILYKHCTRDHLDCVTNFVFDHSFTISFSIDDKYLVLREKEGVLFILNNRAEKMGNLIAVSHIGPPSSEEVHSYYLASKIDGRTHTFHSFTKTIQNNYDNLDFPLVGLFLGPDASHNDNRKTLDICIARGT